VDLAQGLRRPDRKGAPLGPSEGALQEREAVE
jgi:urea transport system permease protein